MNEIIKIRRDLHTIPEPGNKEFKTSKFIYNYLKKLGLKPKKIGTNVICLLIGKKSGKTIAIRADIDALPIQEENKISYKSKHSGFMHACGHDAHTAILLSLAKNLSKNKSALSCNIKFIFQAAEEGLIINKDNEKWGAKYLIEKGILKNPTVSAILGFHVHPSLPVGQIQSTSGVMSRFNDAFKITIFGKSAHITKPHLGKDPILPASQIIIALNNLKTKLDPFKDVIIGVGKINAGTKDNIIANKAEFTLNIRSYENKYQAHLVSQVKKIINGICRANKLKYKITQILSYPGIFNNKKLTSACENLIANKIGSKNIIHKPFGSSEDFCFYSKKVPGYYFLIGSNDGTARTMHTAHTSRFDIAENVLELGKKIITTLILH